MKKNDVHSEKVKLKEIRKKLESQIEASLPTEFKERHKQREMQQEASVQNIREVDEQTAKRIVEAVLFSASRPISVNEMRKILRGYSVSKIEILVQKLQEEYRCAERSFCINEVAHGYELSTLPYYYRWLRKADMQRRDKTASPATLETLAILAYKQPVTRAEIEILRGVDVAGILSTLLEKKFIRIVGRKEVPGRPLMYATTDLFLQHFGLKSLSDLPRINEIKEFVQSTIKKETLVEQEKIETQQEEKGKEREAALIRLKY